MQNKMLQNSICDSERSEIPKDFFGKLREAPCAAGGKRPAAQGRPRRLACPGCQKPREGRRGKEGRFRYPRDPASWPARVPTLGCPSPYICLQKRIPDMFFKKFQKIFRQMRDKYHYKAYVAFRMRENCTECRSNNSGSPIQYPIWPRPVSGRSYPRLPQKAASVWMHALSLS